MDVPAIENEKIMNGNEQPRNYQSYLLVGVLCLLCGLSVAMIQYKVPTIMTSLMDRYGLDASGGAWLMSIFTFVGIFLAIPVGSLARRIGAKTVMLCGSVVAIIGSIIGAWALSGGMLMFSRAIEGCALMMVTMCGVVVIEKTVSPARIGSAMGIWGVWGSAGSVIAGVLTPTLFGAIGMRGLWLSYAAFAAVAALLLALFVRFPGRASRAGGQAAASELADAIEEGNGAESAEQNEPKPMSVVEDKPRYREVFTRNTVLLFISFAAFNVVLLATLSFVPTILQSKGFNPTMSGFVSTLPMLLSLVASPIFGALSDRISWKPLLVLSTAVLGPAAFVMYNFEGAPLWIAAVVMGLIGLGSVAMMLVGLMKVMPRPEVVEIGTGVFITVQCVGQFLGSYLIQILLGPSFANTLVAGAAVMVIGIVGAVCAAMISTEKTR